MGPGGLAAWRPAHQSVLSVRVRAYEGLGFNARERGTPSDAVEAYQEALARIPEAEAHFHFLLGRHYHDGGRPELAQKHLRQAIALDRANYAEQARPLLDALRRETPGCLLGK